MFAYQCYVVRQISDNYVALDHKRLRNCLL